MKRSVYLAGIGYIAISGMLLYREYANRYTHHTAFTSMDPAAEAQFNARQTTTAVAQAMTEAEAVHSPAARSPEAWFAGVRASCNALEADLALQRDPPPATTAGAAYAAACLALAGHSDKARVLIDALPEDQRGNAANIVFEVVHPVADAGDNASAGPMMELVVRYLPDHYMALYHAGMAEYGLGQNDLVREHLERFMQLYTQEDGWRGSARGVLAKLGGNAGP